MSNTLEQGRVSKREFVQRVGRRAGVPLRVTTQVYDAIFDEIKDLASQGISVTLTGFGKFYPQAHKGHRVQFSKDEGTGEVRDYTVLKFSATREVNKTVKPPADES